MATHNVTNMPEPTTNGQLIIGSTGALPSAATLTQGTGITITNAAGSITIATSGGASALVFIATVTASASATIDFTNKLSSTYDNYLITLETIIPATTSTFLQMQVGDATPTWATTSYSGGVRGMKTASGAYTVFGVASATTKCDLTPNSSGALVSSGGAGNGINGSILITGLGSAAGSNVCHNSVLAYPCVDSVSSSFWVTSHAGGGNLTASANKSIRLIMSSGNITAGVAKLYGIQNS